MYIMNMGTWCKRYSRELQEMMGLAHFVKGQRVQWLDHILRRRANDSLGVTFEWKP